MKIESTALPGVLLIEPDVFGDSRGFFLETWNRRRYHAAGLDQEFVQDNMSLSRKGILRGLHFQNPNPQGKLVQVLQGEVFDVAVDIRVGSPTFGRWFGVHLSGENHLQLYVPEGFAHGFCVLSETALFSYKCTDFYNPDTEYSLRWDDPDLGITWPIETPVLSAKDQSARFLKDFPRDALPTFQA
ncbi:dTDP-4-dehydrorhamnose 3,5-epimerase [Methylocaldum szegediense]|uniref:dTDP-4-dehydrorhamnose 3,5-epimerase n=1 Tax=Methylocaldum szegediense TaxID=73780 RepID=A0ABM9I6E2_9GAMM|nr:dTDP-4-dehydrorhamnose 3,5-epimerase [Methylocaldum szegediense]CAI8922691.1 dTDP-4-dehydrorhamnose 3,5-epimerase [Methylocaldum szegediense]